MSNSPSLLEHCDREPIHIPGGIQPHGILIVLTNELRPQVTQVSANGPEWLGKPVPEILGSSLTDLFGPTEGGVLEKELWSGALDEGPLFLRTVPVHSGKHAARIIAHRYCDRILLELELTESIAEVSFRDLYPLVRSFIKHANPIEKIEELCQMTSAEVRQITGFDRVLVYRFDPNWHGNVIAESMGGGFEPYLGMWFPATDIPAQARELYRLNRLRHIADAGQTPIPLVPALDPITHQPTDLTFATLRGVSPVHLEYMRNMGTQATLSIAVYREDRLWGLISCHHRTPRIVSFETRVACELIGQYLSQQLASHEKSEEYTFRLRLKAIQTELVAQMAAEKDFLSGLQKSPSLLLQFCSASGVAILFDDQLTLFGQTPGTSEINELVKFLAERKDELFYSDALEVDFPPASQYRSIASGMLALELSKLYRSYLIWFRPEAVQTVNWAGDPRKSVQIDSQGTPRLHPRKSFEQWSEVVQGHSQPWHAAEIATSRELRNDIVGIVLRKAEEMAHLAAELRRANEELESFSYSVSHDLRAPYRHIVGYGELLRERIGSSLDETSKRYLQTIMDAAQGAGHLVDSLLSFSQITRTTLNRFEVDLQRLIRLVRRELEPECVGRKVVWNVHALPSITGDPEMLRVVFTNLLNNAIKYTARREEALIEIDSRYVGREIVVSIKDNGAGFDMRYIGKLFGTFQRLHSDKDFPGTGIGLALSRRIISRHGGRIWAEGQPDVGATFYLAFPIEEKDRPC